MATLDELKPIRKEEFYPSGYLDRGIYLATARYLRAPTVPMKGVNVAEVTAKQLKELTGLDLRVEYFVSDTRISGNGPVIYGMPGFPAERLRFAVRVGFNPNNASLLSEIGLYNGKGQVRMKQSRHQMDEGVLTLLARQFGGHVYIDPDKCEFISIDIDEDSMRGKGLPPSVRVIIPPVPSKGVSVNQVRSIYDIERY